MKQKQITKQEYQREQLSQQLLTLLMQRNDYLLTSEEYERELDGIRLALPSSIRLTESESEEGTHFVLRNVATDEVLDEFDFRRLGGMKHLSFK